MTGPIQLATLSFCAILFAAVVHCYDTKPLQKGFKFSAGSISLLWKDFRPLLGSPAGIFSLGFQEANSVGTFVLCIMFTIRSNGSSEATEPLSMEKVWSANGNAPGSSEAVLSLNDNGSLVLTDRGGVFLWSTGTSSGETVQLEDSGNLIVLGNQSERAWQSFDHPTDTILTGQNFTSVMRLATPISKSDPSKGFFFLKMEETGMALYANLSANPSDEMYWVKPADQETATIDPADGMIYARMDKKGFLGMYQAETERVSFQTFTTYNQSNISRRLKIDSDGNLRAYSWNFSTWEIDFEAVTNPCSLPAPCGAYGVCDDNGSDGLCVCPSRSNGEFVEALNVSFSAINSSDPAQGCAPSVPLGDCSSLNESSFLEFQGIDSVFHTIAEQTQLNSSSLEECKQLCVRNCACAAFIYSNASANKCYLSLSSLFSFFQSTTSDNVAFIRVSSVSQPLPSVSTGNNLNLDHRHRSVAAMVIAVAIGAAVAFLLCAFAVWRYRRRKDHGIELEAFLGDSLGLPPRFTHKELGDATANFSRTRPGGPLGPLYEGVLAQGTRVVMRGLSNVGGDVKALRMSVAAINQIQHENIARLRGFCAEGTDVVLVYELASQGALERCLSENRIGWSERMAVALGVARALEMLHEETLEPVVHGMLALETIFVGEGAVAKVIDVGIWKLLCETDGGERREELERKTSSAALARGAEPRGGAAASKDVFSFGVVAAELLTGRRGLEDWRAAAEMVSRGGEGWREAVDARVRAEATEDEAVRLATTAALCLQPAPSARPAMSIVVGVLDGSLAPPPLPSPPARVAVAFGVAAPPRGPF